MRYAVVSDIHANIQAWNAVLTDIAAQRVERILCLGDHVGYGPNPSDVLESVYRHVDGFCMGNHDAAVCGKLDPDLFNDHARRLIEWTCGRLSARALRFLGTQPLTLSGPGFRCVHGDFTEPAAFRYVEEAADAAACWRVAGEPLLFTGHTHVPALFVIGASGTTHHLEPQDFVMEPGKRYLVNPGSAGNPRDGDALATYCIHDDVSRSVIWRHVPFDLDACRAALRDAGFPDADTHYLDRDPRRHLTEVREAVSFSPPSTTDKHARDVVSVSELARISRSARRWKRLALTSALAAILVAMAGSGVLMHMRRDIPIARPSSELEPVLPAGTENILPPFPPAAVDGALPGWRVRVESPATTAVMAAPGRGVIVTITGAPARYRIESPPVRLETLPGERLLLRSAMQREEGFKGTARFVVEQLGEPVRGIYPVLMRETKDPPPKSPLVRFTTDASRRVSSTSLVRLAIEGEHRGRVTFSSPTLETVRPVRARR